jgi:hypothetical protein
VPVGILIHQSLGAKSIFVLWDKIQDQYVPVLAYRVENLKSVNPTGKYGTKHGIIGKRRESP